MWKLTKQLIVVALIAFAGYAAYDYYRADLHTRPDMPEGAFSISYKNGMRAILVDVPNERHDRRYLGTPMEVPFYLEDTWSFCFPPSGEEVAQAKEFIENQNWPGERFEAVCKIEVDNKIIVRGLVTSVPKL